MARTSTPAKKVRAASRTKQPSRSSGTLVVLQRAAGELIGPDQAQRIGAVWRCIAYLQGMIAQVPWLVYRPLDGGGAAPDPLHTVTWILNRRANPELAAFKLREVAMRHILLYGNFYAEIERDGFITSGDVGYIDRDGYVFICDRKRDMVISGGVNIYPAEIEAALHGVPGVRDCAVLGIPDDEFGEALMAVVEPQAGVTLDITVVRAQLKALLADYKVPKHLEIQTDLPREDSGKIFKRRLRDPYWAKAGRSI